MKTDLFRSCGHCWVFQLCWLIECSTFTASSFRVWNSWTGIPSPLLALFIVMLWPTWLHIPGCLALGGWSHHHDYLGHADLFCTVLCIHRILWIHKERRRTFIIMTPFFSQLNGERWTHFLSLSSFCVSDFLTFVWSVIFNWLNLHSSVFISK